MTTAVEKPTSRLRATLDAIDSDFVNEGASPYCNFRIADARASWRKGWAVIEAYPDAKTYDGKPGGDRQSKKAFGTSPNAFSWDAVAKDTGRSDKSIRSWVEFAIKVGPDTSDFEIWAEAAEKRFIGQLQRKSIAGKKDDPGIVTKVKPTIYLESWETWLPDQPECDLLISDPPYSTDIDNIEEFAQAWLPVALGKLKPTGRAYVFIGAYPREIAAYINTCMPQQILVWEYRNTLGPMPSYDYILNWQAILYYRGPDAPKWKDDILLEHTAVQNIGQERPSKHQWQKPMKLANMLIQQATDPGAIILDPFAGTGTFLLAAGILGRYAAGCDISQSMIDIAKRRGCNVGSK